ncbi:MAG: hypothetical protein NWE89_06245 [Candidatus Bathyarchaeota archaeon]|nr:hypothetical protein [Candidatus Bathyarchaeota archaeon]
MVKKQEGQETGDNLDLQTGDDLNAQTGDDVKTPTTEEIKAEYETKILTLEKERDEATKGLKTAHSRLTKADQDAKGRTSIDTRIDGLEDTLKILASMQSETLAAGDMEPEQRREHINRFDAEIKRQKEARDKAQAVSQQEESRQNIMVMSERAEVAFGDDLDAIAKVRDMLVAGYNDLAEKKIAQAEGKKTTDTKENKVESEEDRINKLVEEQLRQRMEAAGMLASETGGPSGAATSERDAYAKYAAGEITAEEAGKRGVKFA